MAKILGAGTRPRTQALAELISRYLFQERPGKGNDKGMVERLVGYARQNFFVPAPRCTAMKNWTNGFSLSVAPGESGYYAAIQKRSKNDLRETAAHSQCPLPGPEESGHVRLHRDPVVR